MCRNTDAGTAKVLMPKQLVGGGHLTEGTDAELLTLVSNRHLISMQQFNEMQGFRAPHTVRST